MAQCRHSAGVRKCGGQGKEEGALEGLTLGNVKGLPWLNAATVQV